MLLGVLIEGGFVKEAGYLATGVDGRVTGNICIIRVEEKGLMASGERRVSRQKKKKITQHQHCCCA